MDFKPGALVRLRDREWVVLPATEKDVLLLKPLDGSDTEITGIYLPLARPEDQPVSAQFQPPTATDIGDFSSARLLFNAGRLALRHAAGPFRSLAKLSCRPRAYQMVPLIMALKQSFPIRLLIADDVGVGKTIEALLIVKELLERGDIKSFAIICPPHLCDQWQAELLEKFAIHAVIIRSSTQSRLDRESPPDIPVYQFYPFQVISVDYIKVSGRRQTFVSQAPDLIVVDEAHTCTMADDAESARQQRFKLVQELSVTGQKHLILLTATPHSGKTEQFNSLLSLLKTEYRSLNLDNADEKIRKELARHFIQRRRGDVRTWLMEETLFPERETKRLDYQLTPAYQQVYWQVGQVLLENVGEGSGLLYKPSHYWSLLSLLRGVMSSPATGAAMLRNRIKKNAASEPEESPLLEEESGAQDYTPTTMLDSSLWPESRQHKLDLLASQLDALATPLQDKKAGTALKLLTQWLAQGYNAVVFCKYIATANYLGTLLKSHVEPDTLPVEVRVITSEEPDDVRRERIDEMKPFTRKILVATECLSEGINLQEQFNAVLHYDLPWNPNRLEQRDGRVDRFGQLSKTVKSYLLLCPDNPMDKTVFDVLLKKVGEIYRTIGIHFSFSSDSMQKAVLQAVLAQPGFERHAQNKRFDFGPEFSLPQQMMTRELAAMEAREKMSRSIFAHHALKAKDIERDLAEVDLSMGSPAIVEAFVCQAMMGMGVQMERLKQGAGYRLFTTNLEEGLRFLLPQRESVLVGFLAPVPPTYVYLGRNHPFVEQLCRLLLGRALAPATARAFRPARTAVLVCGQVQVKTTLLLLRVRLGLQEHQSARQLVAEEMVAWGYRGFPDEGQFLLPQEVADLMQRVEAATGAPPLSLRAMNQYIGDELADLHDYAPLLEMITRQRATALVEAHQRFSKLARGTLFTILEPLLPVDHIGIYILLPESLS